MKLKFKKAVQDASVLGAAEETSGDIYEPDFIPYACHYAPDTLLTKNGELIQTIKIVGFSFELVDREVGDLRETIRQAVMDGLHSDDFAVWFHTIRRRKNLAPAGSYKEAFPKYVHDTWNKRHDWENKYINELFITIVRDGESGSISTANRFMRALLVGHDVSERERHLALMHEELDTVTTRMLQHLESYGAHKLTTYQKNGVHYSEPLRFLSKIIKLREESVPLEDVDLSHQLGTHDVTFGFDVAEVRAPDGQRRYGAMLTVKEYRELSLASIDELLQLPEEFIVTQSMNFIQQAKAYKSFKFQHYIAGLSGDQSFARVSGLQDIVDSDQGRHTDYGEQQLTIFLVADDIKYLSRYMERTVNALNSLGIVAMREDLRLEEAYWAQLPGNFAFLKRLKPINISRIAGFANLSNFPAGKAVENHWGPAVTIFNTAANTPYFFNFHIGEVGHTTIIGPYGAGKTVLLNFLLSEARKFNNKLFFFDQNRGAEIFIRALGGSYARLSPTRSDVALNPLKLPDTEANRNFLLLWVEALVSGASGLQLNGSQDRAIEEAVTQLYTLPHEQRTLREFAKLMENIDDFLARRLSPWHSGGSHSGLFDHEEDALDISRLVCGFDMTEVVKDRHSVAPSMLYLVQRIMSELDGTPSIIVLDEAWDLMDNPVFAPRLHGWLEALTRKNALAIFATESVEDASQSALSRAVFSGIATQIYLPNPTPSSAYQSVFGLNETEFSFLELMDPEQRHFLLKKGNEAIIARLSLEGMNTTMSVLSSNDYALEVMQQTIAEKGSEPTDWLPLYMERMTAKDG